MLAVSIGDSFTLGGGAGVNSLFPDFASLFSITLHNIFILAGILAFFYLLAGGFKYIMSSGKPEEIGKAGSMIMNALVGLIIIFLAYWLVQIISTVTGVGFF